MEVDAISRKADNSEESASAPSPVRMIVINNSQIIIWVFRAGLTVSSLAALLGLLLRVTPAGELKEIGKTFDIALIAVVVGLLILWQFLELALRRCPVCLTRITSATKEKRHCLECKTALWDYWDE